MVVVARMRDTSLSGVGQSLVMAVATGAGRVAATGPLPLTYGPSSAVVLSRRRIMLYWLGVLLAAIGATLILSALAFVSALIGVLVNAMIVLMCGPIIDSALARRGRGAAGS
jgi:hypothetical protein